MLTRRLVRDAPFLCSFASAQDRQDEMKPATPGAGLKAAAT